MLNDLHMFSHLSSNNPIGKYYFVYLQVKLELEGVKLLVQG